MKIVIAPDSYKESLSASEVAQAIEKGFREIFPDAQYVSVPVADGGEGTVEAMIAATQGAERHAWVTGPLGEKVNASWGISGDGKTAFIEMAAASGLELVPAEKRDPLVTTSRGTGELILQALESGATNIIIGIGGSATNDGGAGMLQALGYDFLDSDGKPIPQGAAGLERLASIGSDNVLPELSQCRFCVACDVTNPLCGELGASAIYGPQKGATPEMVRQMDLWLGRYAALAAKTFPRADASFPGTGAAGGLGFAFLTFTDAVLESGIHIVLEETHLADYIRNADLVITGEGRLDGQTAMGKAPVGVAGLAKQFGKPVLAFAGCVTEDAVACNHKGIDAFFPILRTVTTLSEAMEPGTAMKNMVGAAEQAMRLWKACREAR
ncbi:MAG: glycerate kinase [Escherichia sp.]|uniref:glycerate kinase n=1 Tax=Escherichia sp. TaxID=1884818 RepID=UPI0028452F39|nr:glycerate kinase [Escherichia sp.]MDR3953744.1 glycerate kinase [Escherichia sp.]